MNFGFVKDKERIKGKPQAFIQYFRGNWIAGSPEVEWSVRQGNGKTLKTPKAKKKNHSPCVIRSDFHRNPTPHIGGLKTLYIMVVMHRVCYLSQTLYLPVPYVSTIQGSQ